MTPENTAFFVVAPSELTKQKLDRKEKWLGANYTVVKIDEQKKVLWNEPSINTKLGLSSPNSFIPSNLSILSQQKENLLEMPKLLVEDSFGKCYYAKDTYYLVPSVSIQVDVKSPLLNAQTKSLVQADLFVLHLHRKLTPTLFSANRAGLSAYFSKSDLKLHISVDGYSDKIGALTSTLMQALKNNTPTKEDFDLIKDELLNTYENQSLTLPYLQAKSLLLNMLYDNYPLSKEQIETLREITYEEFINFQEQLFAKAYLEGVIAGNIDSSNAEAVWKQIVTNLSASIYPENEHNKKKILTLPEGLGPFTIKSSTDLQGNAAILMLQLNETSPKSIAAEKILAKATSEAFFNTLRTKQQIAYIAQSWGKEEENDLLLFFAVHSATHPPEELLARFELFLEDFTHNFETYIPEERFQSIKQSLMTTLSKSPENLSSYANELNTLAFTWRGDFIRKSKIIKACEHLSYEDFKTVSLSFLSRKNTKRIAFLVKGTPLSDHSLHYHVANPLELKSHQK
jgi:insulysin